MVLILDECRFCHGNPEFDFTRTSRITCYQATQIVEIFHILRLLLILHDDCFEILITLFSFIALRVPASNSVSRMSCNTIKSHYQYLIIILTYNSPCKVVLSNLRLPQSVNEFQILWNSKCNYHIYRCLQFALAVSKMNPFHSLHLIS